MNSHILEDLFTDVTINTYKTSVKNSHADDSKDLDLKKLNISLYQYLSYFETYSGFHNYKEETGNADLIRKDFVKELLDATGWDLEKTRVDLVWNTGYTCSCEYSCSVRLLNRHLFRGKSIWLVDFW